MKGTRKKLVLLTLTLTLMLSMSINAYASTGWDNALSDLPTLKDDGIDGSKMTPGSPAFGNYVVEKIEGWDNTLSDLPTLKDDGIDGSKMTPGSTAFGNYVVEKIEDTYSISSTLVFDGTVSIPKNVTGTEGKRIATFKLQPGETKVRIMFLTSQNSDDMDQINVSLANYSAGTVIDWLPGLPVGSAVTFTISNPSYTDYYAIYVSTDQTPTNARLQVITE